MSGCWVDRNGDAALGERQRERIDRAPQVAATCTAVQWPGEDSSDLHTHLWLVGASGGEERGVQNRRKGCTDD